MRNRRPPRLAREFYIGFVRLSTTMCTIDRRSEFVTERVVFPLRDELLQQGRNYRTEIVVHRFMPDHLHVLFEGQTPDSRVLGCAEMFRQRTGRSFRAAHGRHVWQEGFHDRILRRAKTRLPWFVTSLKIR